MRKRQLEATIDAVFEACKLCNMTKGERKFAIPWKKTIKRMSYGYEITFTYPYGKCFEDVQKEYDKIAVSLRGAEIQLAKKGHQLVMKVFNEPLPAIAPFTMKMLEPTYHTFKVPILTTHEKVIYHDFDDYPHLKIGSATRKGKSEAMKIILNTLLYNYGPDRVKLILIDGKDYVTFQKYDDFPHVVEKAWNVPTAYATMKWVREELDKRKKLLKKARVESVKEYEEVYEESLARYFIVIDEAYEFRVSDARSNDEKEIRKAIAQEWEHIASQGASWGFSLIFCTQRPDRDTIPSLVKANIEATLALRTSSIVNSQILLDNDAAYKLPNIRGRAIYQTAEEPVIGQVPYMGFARSWWWLFELSSKYKLKRSLIEEVELIERIEEEETITVR